MASTTTTSPFGLPGLDKALEIDDMNLSCHTYNDVPYINTQPKIADEHIKALLDIIGCYKMGDFFAVHMAYRHDVIPAGTVRLESKLGNTPGKWVKATLVQDLDLENIHPTIYKLIDDRLVPLEFSEGPPLVLTGPVDVKFIREITSSLMKEELTKLVALQFGVFTNRDLPLEPTTEIEVDGVGTIVLPISIINSWERVPTGWNVRLAATAVEGDKPPPGETWAPMVNTSHKVFTNKGANITPDELIAELHTQGIIKT